MTHKEFKKLLVLLVHDEISDQDRLELDAHLTDCLECRMELDELRNIVASVARMDRPSASQRLLEEGRQNLHRALLAEPLRGKWWRSAVRRIGEFFEAIAKPSELPRYAYVLGAIAVFALGGALGYLAFPSRTNPGRVPASYPVESDLLNNASFEINNVQFLGPETTEGRVELAFDATQHLKTKGNINDENIRKLLAYSLVNETNAGVRLKSLDLINTSNFKFPDRAMKLTLIKVLKSDDNAGVRKEALSALEKFSFDDTVKDAFVYVLANDPNPGLRIAAIDGLVTRVAGQLWDTEILRTLRDKMQSDDNKYIRVRAKTLLEDLRK